MEEKIFDLIILGGGPAGLNAALYAKRGNYLGFPTIQGWELAEKFEQHIDKFNIQKFQNEEIQNVDLTSTIKTVQTLKNKYLAKTIIIATGASPKKLGIRGEDEYIGKGVSYCAVCDGAFYNNKTVVVIGGGNAAVEEGIYLTKFAEKVYIMHRRDELRADKIIQERAFDNEKIEFIFDSIPLEIVGDSKKVNLIQYKNVKTGEIKTLNVDGVFPYIGFSPNTEFFNAQLVQDEFGFIRVDENMRTSEVGVFAAGDVRRTPLRQVITAVADGAIAGMSAVKYLEEVKHLEKEGVNIR